MSTSRRRNDRQGDRPRSFHRPRGKPSAGGGDWLWGRHAVTAALANPRREGFDRLVLGPGRATPGGAHVAHTETLETAEISRLLPQGAVHQGYALLAKPLVPATLEEIGEDASGVILMLDQVTDPQNIGAILRSAAAFGARGVVLQDRHAPALSGALSKAAAGAADVVPIARVVNLSRALERLADLGWRAVGLAGGGNATLDEVLDGSPTVIVLGSEGEGLRRLVADHCDAVARIHMPGGFESLNVSAAAAVALYEASKLARPANSTP